MLKLKFGYLHALIVTLAVGVIISATYYFGYNTFIAQSGNRNNSNEGLSNGIILVSPLTGQQTHLINFDGETVHTWEHDTSPRAGTYLMENGNLIRMEHMQDNFFAGGRGGSGQISEYTWDGDLVWRYVLNDKNNLLHHDFDILPNGNILAIAWEKVFLDDLGINTLDDNFSEIENELWMDRIIEIDKNSQQIVWEWRVQDNIYQNKDKSNAFYEQESGNKLDITTEGDPTIKHDWNHSNSLDFNPETGEIAMSARGQNQVWIIDYDPANTQSKSPIKQIISGDLLMQHDARWIDSNTISLFNNGNSNREQSFGEVYSRIDGEWNLKQRILDEQNFYSHRISGMQYLGNNSYLVTLGVYGAGIIVQNDTLTNWNYTYINEDNEEQQIFKYIYYNEDYAGLSKIR